MIIKEINPNLMPGAHKLDVLNFKGYIKVITKLGGSRFVDYFFRIYHNKSTILPFISEGKRKTLAIIAHGVSADGNQISPSLTINTHVSFLVKHGKALYRDRILNNKSRVFSSLNNILDKNSYRPLLSKIPIDYHYIYPKSLSELNTDFSFINELNYATNNDVTVAIFTDYDDKNASNHELILLKDLKIQKDLIVKINSNLTQKPDDFNQFKKDLLTKKAYKGKKDEVLKKLYELYSKSNAINKKIIELQNKVKRIDPFNNFETSNFLPAFPLIEEFSSYFENIIFVTCRSPLNKSSKFQEGWEDKLYSWNDVTFQL